MPLPLGVLTTVEMDEIVRRAFKAASDSQADQRLLATTRRTMKLYPTLDKISSFRARICRFVFISYYSVYRGVQGRFSWTFAPERYSQFTKLYRFKDEDTVR